jgi:hypothetical protein
MIGLFWFVLAVLASPFKSKVRLEAENAVLRHQLIVLRRRLRDHFGDACKLSKQLIQRRPDVAAMPNIGAKRRQ